MRNITFPMRSVIHKHLTERLVRIAMEHIAVQMVQNIAVLFAVTVIGIIDAPRASQQCQTGQFHIALSHILFFVYFGEDLVMFLEQMRNVIRTHYLFFFFYKLICAKSHEMINKYTKLL